MFMRQEKNGYYYIYYQQENGKRSKISTKSKTVTKANRFFSNLQKETEERKNKSVKAITLQEFKKVLYEKTIRQNKISTVRIKLSFVNKLMEYFGKSKLTRDITPEDIYGYLDSLSGKNQLSTIKENQNKFIGLLRLMKKEGYYPKNYYYERVKIKVPKRIPKYFTREQFFEFYQKCSRKDLRDISAMAYFTGLRQSDLVKLKWSNVDLVNNHIVNMQKKTDQEDVLPLNSYAVNVLKEQYLKRTDETVFTYETKTHKVYDWTAGHLRDVFKTEKIRIFGKDCNLTFHSFRHGFASALINSKVDLFTISKLLGHRDISSAKIYAHLETTEMREATNLLNKLNFNTN